MSKELNKMRKVIKDGDAYECAEAYGLSSSDRETIANMAETELYYVAYIADRYNKPISQIEDICLRLRNYVCKSIENINGEWVHTDGYYKELTLKGLK